MLETPKWSSVVQRANVDPEFKKTLVENPRIAIEKMMGITLSSDVEFVVHEQSAKVVHLVLPISAANPKPKKAMGIFVERDDAKGIFLEAEDAKGIFVERDDAKGIFLEAEDAKGIFVEADDL